MLGALAGEAEAAPATSGMQRKLAPVDAPWHSQSMDANAWVGLVALLVAGVALYFTGMAARATRAQAESAIEQTRLQREQTELQREIQREAAQPFVWADVRPDMKRGTLFLLVVGNSGPTLAHNIRVEIAPDLPHDPRLSGHSLNAVRRLRDGIRSLTPGRTVEWTLGRTADIVGEDKPVLHTITVDADGPYGPLRTLTYEIDLSDIRESSDNPDGSIHLLTRAVSDAGREIARAANRPPPTTLPPLRGGGF